MARLRHLTVHDENAMSTMCAGLDSRIGSLEARANASETGIQNLAQRCGTIETAVDGKAPAVHTHAWADISGKPTIPTIITRAKIQDVDTNTPTGVLTNAPNNAPTGLSPLLLLGAAIGEMNATNQRQNQIADVANTNGTKLAALITIVKDMPQKLNLTFDTLEDNKLLAVA